MKQQQKVRPLFQNKAPLRPIRASKVQERHQVDLVSMASMPATIDLKLRSDLVNYLRSNPATPDGTHFSEFINLGAWDTYLRRMAMDGEWGDWIALWGLINMLEIPVAIVSSLGETGLNVIYPADYQNEAQATGDMALLGHEAELHYHSLEPMASQKPQLALV